MHPVNCRPSARPGALERAGSSTGHDAEPLREFRNDS